MRMRMRIRRPLIDLVKAKRPRLVARDMENVWKAVHDDRLEKSKVAEVCAHLS